MKFIDLESKSKEKSCKGRFYRCNINTYISNDKYVYQVSMRLLKRKSCKGCKQCGFLKDDLSEFVYGGFSTLPIIDNPKNGEVYELVVTNISTDWETGYADDWDLEFKLVK